MCLCIQVSACVSCTMCAQVSCVSVDVCLACQHVQQSLLLPSGPGDQGCRPCQPHQVCRPPPGCQETLQDQGYHANLEVLVDPTRKRGWGEKSQDKSCKDIDNKMSTVGPAGPTTPLSPGSPASPAGPG